MGHVTLDDVLNGILPQSLEDYTAACGELIKLARRIVPVSALLVASCRREHFFGQRAAWVDWAKEATGLEGSELHHRRAIGDLLLDARDVHEPSFRRLFELDSRKLLPICQISKDQIVAFLKEYKVEGMSREEVRDAVKVFLGLTLDMPRQPKLPGFDEAVEAVSRLDANAMRYAINDPELALKSLAAGMGLLGAAVEFQRSTKKPDVELLVDLRKTLLDEAEAVGKAIADLTDSSVTE